MVLALEADKDVFIKKVEHFKEMTSSPDSVCFAAGWCYATVGTIRKALQNADSNMYADKEEFYKKYPERKR